MKEVNLVLFIFLLLLFLYLFLTRYYITEDVTVKEVLEDKIIFESELGKEIILKITKPHKYLEGQKGQVSFHGERIVISKSSLNKMGCFLAR